MRKGLFLLILSLFISCATMNSTVNITKSSNMKFYVIGNDRLGLNNVIVDYIKNKGYNVQSILDIRSIQQQSELPTKRVSSGTGFFVSDEYIMTCSHVVSDSNTITILKNGTKYNAQIIMDNPSLDFSLLKINGYKSQKYFTTSKFLSENIGNKLYTLGFPLSSILGSDIRVTDGIISSKTGINSDPIYFQMSAPIQPGNSGGPIINERFEVIGIASSKISDQYVMKSVGVVPQNVNFGVKSDYILPILEEYINSQRSNIFNFNDAIEATIQIIVNDDNQSVKKGIISTDEYLIEYGYNSFWDMFTRLNHMTINIYNINNRELVAQAVHSGDDGFSTPSVTTRNLLNEIFSKMK